MATFFYSSSDTYTPDKTRISEKISEFEENFYNQIFDTQMGDLKEWLQEKGIRLD